MLRHARFLDNWPSRLLILYLTAFLVGLLATSPLAGQQQQQQQQQGSKQPDLYQQGEREELSPDEAEQIRRQLQGMNLPLSEQAGVLNLIGQLGLRPQQVQQRWESAGQETARFLQRLQAEQKLLDPEQFEGLSFEEQLRLLGVEPVQQMRLNRIIQQSGFTKEELKELFRQSNWDVEGLKTLIFSAMQLRSAGIEITPEKREKPLRLFGTDFFKDLPAGFEPIAMGPVDPTYPLGPGDELILTLTGDVELEYKLTVSREGYVVIPEVGRVLVHGKTLKEVEKSLFGRFSSRYSGITGSPDAQTHYDVSLGKLRVIQVFMVGEVVRPGGYILPATSRAMHALYFAGGPTQGGSLRNVRIVRGGETIAAVDLYEYLLRGDNSGDIRLENLDTIVVPPVKKTAAIKGQIFRPAVYELKEGETLEDLVELAGGLAPDAFAGRVQIERIQDHHQVVLRDVDLAEAMADPETAIPLQNGDAVIVFAVAYLKENVVTLRGPVRYPGDFEWRQGMTLTDLLAKAGGPLDQAFPGRADIVRTEYPEMTKHLIPVNLRTVMAGDGRVGPLYLQPRDEVALYSTEEMKEERTIAVYGLVKTPGEYPYYEGMTVKDLIFTAGGLEVGAYKVEADISRIDPLDGEYRAVLERARISDRYEVVMDGWWDDGREATPGGASLAPGTAEFAGDPPQARADGSRNGFLLEPYDNVFVRLQPGWELQRNVVVSGEVKFPGTYTLRSKEERISQVLERAGGLKPTAYPPATMLHRTKEDIGNVNIDLPKILRHRGSVADLAMASGDSLHVPEKANTVRVEGAVNFPTSVLWEKGKSFEDYVRGAGGYSSAADNGKAYVQYANGEVDTKGGFLFFGGSPRVERGSRIVVPTKPPPQGPDALDKVLRITSVVSSIATTIFLIERATN